MKVLRLGQSLCSSNSPNGEFENLYSLSFDGVDDYLDLGSGAALTPNTSGADRGFSISFWAKVGTSKHLFSTASGTEIWSFVRYTGQINFYFFGDNNTGIDQHFQIDDNIADGNWHNFIFTFDLGSTSSSIVAYLDGVKKTNGSGGTYGSAGTWAAVSDTGGNLRIGYGGGGYSDSQQDDMSIYDNVLTDAQATEIYNSGTPGDVSSIPYLIGWWRNGDPDGTSSYPTITDDSTNSNNGTMTNMVSSDITTDVP
jgi:hypothetical protein